MRSTSRTAIVASLALCAFAACSRDESARPNANATAVTATTASTETAANNASESACAGPGETVDKGDGLSVERVRVGTGAALSAGDVALARYALRLDGTDTIVASTEGWSTAARIPLTQLSAASGGTKPSDAAGVIAGFVRAIVGERVGSKLTAHIPPALGYGTAGLPAAGIPADATLVAEIEILGVTR